MSYATPQQQAADSIVTRLLPLVGTVFVAFLVVGLAIPVLPLYVRQGLGFGPFAVGLVSGAQFAASLLSRFWSGRHSDHRGPKRAVVVGLFLAALAGVLYAASLPFLARPQISVGLLLLGRAVLGGAESFIITGVLSWALTLAGAQNTGKVIAWIGTAMYVAFAAGGPVGSALYAAHGFMAVALATIAIPMLTLTGVCRLQSVPPVARESSGLTAVLRTVWMPGVGLAFSSVGFGAMTTFVSLLFADRGWGAPWLAFSMFSIAFIVARIFFGHLPDRQDAAKVALVSVLIEATGLVLIWRAGGIAVAVGGAVLTGLGYSLVYPALGVQAVRGAPAASRGLAMGAYTAFLDLTLGVGTPLLGLLASVAGLPCVFLASGAVVACSAVVAVSLLQARQGRAGPSAQVIQRSHP
jgi:MFS family permease